MASPLPPDSHAPHPLSTSREGRAADWLRDNGRVVSGVALAAAVAVLGTVAWRWNERGKESRAERALLSVEAALVQGGGGSGTEGALRTVATRHRGTAAGAQAQLLLAQTQYEQGRYQDGLNTLGGANPPGQFAEAFELMRASGLEGVGRGGDAAKIYERLAGGSDVVARRRDELRAAAARAYQLANDKASALRMWRLVLTEGSGPVVDEARVRVGELG